jgi:chromosome segregation ATPase
MLATIAPLPPPPHLLGEDLDVKKLAAVYTILGIISDPKGHKARLEELGEKMSDLVSKSNEIKTAYDQLLKLKDAVDQAASDQAAAFLQHQDNVAAHDAAHQRRTDALNDRESQLTARHQSLDAKEEALTQQAAKLADVSKVVADKAKATDEKYSAAALMEADLQNRGAALKLAEADYESRLAKLRQFVGT